MTQRKLTYKQKMFIERYFICNLDATEAAMQVYNCKNRHNAQVMGFENLTKPAIRAQVEARVAALTITADEVLARLTQHARGNLDVFIDKHGDIDIEKAREAQEMGLLKKYKKTKRYFKGELTEESVEIEAYDAQEALAKLGKHLNLFNDKQPQDKGPIEIVLRWIPSSSQPPLPSPVHPQLPAAIDAEVIADE